jgi:hypothetical protein
MHWNEGRVTARITVVLAFLAGVLLALTVLLVLWQSAINATAASETRYDGARQELGTANDQIQVLEQSGLTSEDALGQANAQLSRWEARFDTRIKREVKSRVRLAKAHWLAFGSSQAEARGFKAGRSEGYDAGYRDGYEEGVLGGGSPPPQDSGCNANYSGCLLSGASDYDCLGGSGDGPYYTGTVQVLGYDEYDLDRDGDGIGCD